MDFLRKQLDAVAPFFEKGGKLEPLYAFYEANDTILFTPGSPIIFTVLYRFRICRPVTLCVLKRSNEFIGFGTCTFAKNHKKSKKLTSNSFLEISVKK